MTAAEFSTWRAEWPATPPHRRRPLVLVMGVLNVTPDSFSDGGQFLDPAAAAAHATQLIAGGADLLDIGAESTRPGSSPVDPAEQLRRLLPAIQAIRRLSDVAISIDTTSAQVAAAALDAGADAINDISAARFDPTMLPLLALRHAPIILMHMQGTPATMQLNPSYQDVVAEVAAFLLQRRQTAIEAGIDPRDILLDPGIGFGKTLEHNLQLLRATGQLAQFGSPLVLGTSRKSFLRKLWSQDRPSTPADDGAASTFGTTATTAWVVTQGAAIVRVHDAAPAAGVIRIIQAIRAAPSVS